MPCPPGPPANQIHERVERFVNKLFPEGPRPDVILAVPGYNPEDYAPEAVALPKYDEQAGHRHEHGEEKPWASESSKRYLAAQIAVGTVDQAMLGALQVRHAHLRSSCLARNLLVVDEVHASDTYMTEIIRALLAAHTGAGGYALLMSATLGSTAQEKWLRPGQRRADGQGPSLEKAKGRPYPAVSIASNPEPIFRRRQRPGQDSYNRADSGHVGFSPRPPTLPWPPPDKGPRSWWCATLSITPSAPNKR